MLAYLRKKQSKRQDITKKPHYQFQIRFQIRFKFHFLNSHMFFGTQFKKWQTYNQLISAKTKFPLLQQASFRFQLGQALGTKLLSA